VFRGPRATFQIHAQNEGRASVAPGAVREVVHRTVVKTYDGDHFSTPSWSRDTLFLITSLRHVMLCQANSDRGQKVIGPNQVVAMATSIDKFLIL
jgi:hypothetical protein